MTHNTREERELLRLASLVGTDAKNPEEKLLAYVHHQLQKARHDWLWEEVKKLKAIKSSIEEFDYDSDERGKCEILQTIIDRYHSELDQDSTTLTQNSNREGV